MGDGIETGPGMLCIGWHMGYGLCDHCESRHVVLIVEAVFKDNSAIEQMLCKDCILQAFTRFAGDSKEDVK